MADRPTADAVSPGVVSGRYAAIDIGTNSVKLHVAERDAAGSWRRVVDRAQQTRLGEGLDERGTISPEAAERTAAAVAGMVDEARLAGAREIAVVGTAGLRAAANRDQVVAAIADRTRVTVEVISGEEEARLAYLAVATGVGLRDGSLAIFDSGGGSTQVTFGRGRTVVESFSVAVGAVRLTERFGLDVAVSAATLGEVTAAIARGLSRLEGRPAPDRLVGMGGTVTSIAAVGLRLEEYDPDVVQGSVLGRDEVERQVELYRTLTAEERQAVVGLDVRRAQVILAGVCIVRTVMDALESGELTVSDRGVRHGLLIERFGA
jgi:exopolyphosphatase / guanosine-5'-triphosphate,3'-diphosphate pyrophosphatase